MKSSVKHKYTRKLEYRCVSSYWDRPSCGRFAQVVGRTTLSTAPWLVSPGDPWPSTGDTVAPFAGFPNHRILSTAE